MSELTAKQIGKVLSQAASLLELTGENQFSVRSLQSGSRYFQRLNVPLTQALEEIEAGKVKGFGKGLREYVAEIVSTGSLELIDELLAQLPDGLPDLLRIPGLGGKKVRALWKELGITSLDELEAACRSGRIVELKGFAAKTADNILQGIEQIRSYNSKLRIDSATSLGDRLCKYLVESGFANRAVTGGQTRRGCEVVSKTEILVDAESEAALAKALSGFDGLAEVESSGDKTVTAVSGSHPLKFTLSNSEDWINHLVMITGSEEHLAQIAELHPQTDERFEREEDYYHALSAAFIPPELREGRGEVKQSLQLYSEGKSWDLVSKEDLKGVIHAHTTYSDGAHSLKEMAEAARDAGYDYFAVSDHSQSAAYAGGLSPEQIVKQQAEIQELNEELQPFRIFSGIESDILEDGSLDYEEDILASFDFVIASIHSRFGMSEDAMSDRIVNAVNNRFTTILGHPTGRLLLQREPYRVDLERVISACAAANVAIEINAQPKRLDLDWRLLQSARRQGVRIAICPDAHSIDDIKLMKFGVTAARKGGLSAEDIINTFDLKQFESYLKGSEK